MLTHLEKHGSSVRILFFNYFMVINTRQPVLLKNKLERPTWGASPGRVDPGLPHKQTPNCESLGLCVWPLNLQCGDSPGNYPSPLPLHTLHCRLHNGDDCVLKQFSIVSVLVSFLTDDDTEYRGLMQDLYPGLVSPELPSHQCSKNQGDGIGLLSLPLEHPGNKDWMSWLLSTSNKYLGFHLNNKLEWSHKLKLTSVPVSPPAGRPVSSGELQWQTDPPSLCEGWILQLFPSCHCQALQPTLLSVWSICSNQVQSLHKFTQSLCLSNLCFLF